MRALFYDKSKFNAENYALAFGLVTTDLNICLAKGFIEPQRFDYTIVYFLIESKDEQKYKSIINAYKAKELNVKIVNILPITANLSKDKLLGLVREKGWLIPFSDEEFAYVQNLESKKTKVEKIVKNRTKKKEVVSEDLGLTNSLDDMLKREGAKRARRSRKRK